LFGANAMNLALDGTLLVRMLYNCGRTDHRLADAGARWLRTRRLLRGVEIAVRDSSVFPGFARRPLVDVGRRRRVHAWLVAPPQPGRTEVVMEAPTGKAEPVAV
jgi:hypothetical protein